MVLNFRRDDFWTPTFAGVTLLETFSEIIDIQYLNMYDASGFEFASHPWENNCLEGKRNGL
jgi:hypothetical protein